MVTTELADFVSVRRESLRASCGFRAEGPPEIGISGHTRCSKRRVGVPRPPPRFSDRLVTRRESAGHIAPETEMIAAVTGAGRRASSDSERPPRRLGG